MPNAMSLVEALRELTDDEKRFVFRELAKELLDSNADRILMITDNEGKILGYFEPLLHHFRESGKKYSAPDVESEEEFLRNSMTVQEFLERTSSHCKPDKTEG